MLRAQLALVSQSTFVDFAAVASISAAVQKQITRDLNRFWPSLASIDAFARLTDVPSDYWPIMIRDDIGYPGVNGVHWANDRQPFALVQASLRLDKVSLTVSHEAMEMIVDPSGSRVVAGNSVAPGQGRVNYLLEICDPNQKPAFGYRVNNILVSDFVTPEYFDPVDQPNVAYSYGGYVSHPRQVLAGGYLSWIDPATDHLWQAYDDGGTLRFRDGGVYDPTVPIRFQTDRFAIAFGGERDDDGDFERVPTPADANSAYCHRAELLERQIERVVGKAKRRLRQTVPPRTPEKSRGL